MKKIIIATDMWYPEVNGVVRATEMILPYLEKQGFEVKIIHPGLFLSVPLFLYPEMRISFFTKRKIKKIIEDFKPDFIHIVTEWTVGTAVRSVCLQKNLKFTASYHGNISKYAEFYAGIKSRLLFNFVYDRFRKFHKPAALNMVCSDSLKEELEDHGFSNLTICPMGVDSDLFRRNPNSPQQKNNFKKPVFAYFGRIAKEKSVEEFFECNLPGTKLVIGDGPLRKKFENKYKKGTKFLGYKSGQDLVDWLSVCDVFVFPSRTETFGLVILEAMACGVPVAAHNVMGPKDIITSGVDGILDENLEKAALACLGISRDKCREKALKFSWEKSADYFIDNLVKV
ncbi:MAG: hypothetical protein A2599_01025 [Candidatus Staskawiczbacteria bacterium RIFOXYD1_FULL_39_28]|uniref:Glycosyltransferase subfamily 4-like N-terminal domain-containing protein n=1 Tax=Candidatus Staskawiczbacteria bacterium RIFOXYC1_FULL_38_18 TaxID=1802229 RepID=A0A1G2JAH3_9BACT|nr:MAG: hypothetical protein A2401_00745 [Candidatus Staskawiczbacteria bacterium RIFOXYC1_FULL_38_18]OGZ91418.1 MAG: hypothetical protein A2599_01025 [Candidatus Staskawiczbacteria bacterium RIFOXYD1_FULL_39_28]